MVWLRVCGAMRSTSCRCCCRCFLWSLTEALGVGTPWVVGAVAGGVGTQPIVPACGRGMGTIPNPNPNPLGKNSQICPKQVKTTFEASWDRCARVLQSNQRYWGKQQIITVLKILVSTCAFRSLWPLDPPSGWGPQIKGVGPSRPHISGPTKRPSSY